MAAGTTQVAVAGQRLLVTRSAVPADKPYQEYKRYLRHDFFYSCAYCTMSEAEAQAIRFVIDHYEPRKSRPDLVNEYPNLMYCCDECNSRKGDRSPPADARKEGYRFFRPDTDYREDHFRRQGQRVSPLDNVGYYTIEALDLNRGSLRRLREIRERLATCERHIADGVLGLRGFHLDQLPQEVKGLAHKYINQAIAAEEYLAGQIDRLLREYARSALLTDDGREDPDEEERTAKRLADLQNLEAIHPGKWRGPRSRKR